MPRSLDLFAGAGGFTLGLQKAGVQTIGAVEINSIAAASWKANFPSAEVWSGREGDIRRLSPAAVRRRLGLRESDELDFITAGPPCQGFSHVGRAKLDSLADRSGSFLRDPRNALYRRAIEFVAEFQPKAFIFENVTGILHLRGTNMAEVVCDALRSKGYSVACSVMNAAWYGVPQARDRVFILGIRSDLGLRPEFPKIERNTPLLRGALSTAHLAPGTWEGRDYFVPYSSLPAMPELSSAVTVRDALCDLPKLTSHLKPTALALRAMRSQAEVLDYLAPAPNDYCRLMRNWPGFESARVEDHYCRQTPRDFPIFARMQYGDRYPQAVQIALERYHLAKIVAKLTRRKRPSRADFVPPYRVEGFPDKWRKLFPNAPSWTVTAHLGKDGYSHIHFDGRQARTISIREAARLQSFPDGYKFAGSTGQVFAQIGNAVPPLVAEQIARSLMKQMALSRARAA